MYRNDPHQSEFVDFYLPFGGKLGDRIRWVKPAVLVLWATVLFVESPQCLVLTVEPAEVVELQVSAYQIVQAKVGPEFLSLKRMEATSEAMKLIFSGPKRKISQMGLQVEFVAFTTPEAPRSGDSGYLLLRVRWRNSEEASDST